MKHDGGWLEVIGARVHNLRNINVRIPRNRLTVITGLSGSGKSSLAFDTIFAEGQRRYIDTFSSYARGYIGSMTRPDVDKITGLSPVISIDQKTTNKNPRSTVGTVTEVYDYLRLLFARASTAYSYNTGEEMVHYTDEQILDLIIKEFAGRRVLLLSPLVKNRKGHYRELFERYRKKGFMYMRVDGEMTDITFGMKTDRYKNHSIELVVDRLKINQHGIAAEQDRHRVLQSIDKAMQHGEGVMMMVDADDVSSVRYYSRNLMCPTTGISYADPAPHSFSFNSPQGACPHCHGLGTVTLLDMEKIVPDKSRSLRDGAIQPLGKYKKSVLFEQVDGVLQKYGFTLDTPFSELSEETVDELMNGTVDADVFRFNRYEGILHYLELQQENSQTEAEINWVNRYSKDVQCPECKGARLNREALSFKIAGKNIAELAEMDISDLALWLDTASEHMTERQQIIATEILREIKSRIGFMLDVGLGYLSLARTSDSLSGGESQRIRLATQIGSKLVNVLYILDEPSIGLHQRDNRRLINSLKRLRDMGNTIIVVEHDEQMMREADWIVDIGPKAGRLGGRVIFQGTPEELLKSDTLTARYLVSGFNHNPDNLQPVNIKSLSWLTLRGCRGNNLKNIDVSFPLGCMICVTGVSGSGKSTLVNQTLFPVLSQKFYRSLMEPMPFDSIEGIENVDKVVSVDQSPIGRTPRSNPATYTGVFSNIRQLFASVPEAQIRGWKPGRFSFNTAGGRCEDCAGNGYKTIQMHFLPDVYVKCETCSGKRYNRETLEIRFKGKTIFDVLDMTVNQAVEFFESQPDILSKIKTMQEVGLGYIKLGQSSTTLSGGESQRMKLAAELSRRDTGKTVYILDEPTTGLHFDDIRVLLGVLRRLQSRGNTVIIIEHNLDVIRSADYIIDMGPEGGAAGGKIVATGAVQDIRQNRKSLTGKYL